MYLATVQLEGNCNMIPARFWIFTRAYKCMHSHTSYYIFPDLKCLIAKQVIF